MFKCRRQYWRKQHTKACDIRTLAVWRLFESIYFSKLCVKRPFDALPSSLLSLGQEREPRAGVAGLGQIGGFTVPPSEGGPKSSSPFSYPEVPSLTPINSEHTFHPIAGGWESMGHQSFRSVSHLPSSGDLNYKLIFGNVSVRIVNHSRSCPDLTYSRCHFELRNKHLYFTHYKNYPTTAA